MAEVIRALTARESTRYMPFDEMHDRERKQAYEAAGAYLMLAYEIDGPIIEPGDLLIELSSRERVRFPYGGSMNIDALHLITDS